MYTPSAYIYEHLRKSLNVHLTEIPGPTPTAPVGDNRVPRTFYRAFPYPPICPSFITDIGERGIFMDRILASPLALVLG